MRLRPGIHHRTPGARVGDEGRAPLPSVPSFTIVEPPNHREITMTCLAHHNRLAKAVVLGLVVIASTACLAQGRAIGPDPFRGGSSGPSGGSGEIRIQVRNSNFNQATVYAVRVGNRRRLGRVQGATDQQFRMPWPNFLGFPTAA